MPTDSLAIFIEGLRLSWSLPIAELVPECRRQLEQLLKADRTEPWLAALYRNKPASQELYRDEQHGFVLLAHAEQAGLYRPPHDHGRAWVIYAVQQGEVEMGAFGHDDGPGGRLTRRSSTVMRRGHVRAYLPGEVHDTRCLSDTALLFRLTERDLKVEDRVERRVTRFVEQAGTWAPAPR